MGKRFLGVDYGTKRVGIAISDDSGTLAFPEVVLKNDKNLIDGIEKLVNERRINEIVIGESRDFQGNENVVMKDISQFRDALTSSLSVPIYLESEFLTTREALRGGTENVDAKAAALILQRFLDKRKEQRKKL